jgi:hypothetical protein
MHNIASESKTQPRYTANQRNAQLSTGPRTAEGKAASSLNALKSGLTGRTVLLPSDDVDRYVQHVANWMSELKPVGTHESALAQNIADSYWRTDRIVSLEFAVFANGRVQFAEMFAGYDPALRDAMIEAHVYETSEKQLRNLAVQERRLLRQREKDMKELRGLQAERTAAAEAEKERAQAVNEPAKTGPRPTDRIGFEFSPASLTAQTGAPGEIAPVAVAFAKE